MTLEFNSLKPKQWANDSCLGIVHKATVKIICRMITIISQENMKVLLRGRNKGVNPGSHECHENEHLSVMRHGRPRMTKSRHQWKIYYPWAHVISASNIACCCGWAVSPRIPQLRKVQRLGNRPFICCCLFFNFLSRFFPWCFSHGPHQAKAGDYIIRVNEQDI